jgi:hypothetical protein
LPSMVETNDDSQIAATETGIGGSAEPACVNGSRPRLATSGSANLRRPAAGGRLGEASRRGPGLRPEHDSAGCRRRDDLEAMLWSAAAQIRPKGGRTVSVETTIPALPSRLGHRPSGSECIE